MGSQRVGHNWRTELKWTDAEVEAPTLWPPDWKSQLFGKYPDAEEIWRQEKKGMTEDKTGGWYHWLKGHEFEQTPQDSEAQGNLSCCSPWDHKELDMTEQLNNNILFILFSDKYYFVFASLKI